ncbi:MAG: FHA domain-containing protein [Polyangiaceae bacterium]|nr:FHA domain-containing protein [Polyangiaceae bacterium]
MRFVLVIPETGSILTEQRLILGDEGVEIGGTSDCDAIIDHPSVGTARIRIEPSTARHTERGGEPGTSPWVVVDREGRGMCFVDEVRLKPRERRAIESGSVVRLGKVVIKMIAEVDSNDNPSETSVSAASTLEIALKTMTAAPQAGGTRPQLRWAEGSRRGGSIKLPFRHPIVIGRGPACDLLLDDERVSRLHASVEWKYEDDKERVVVTDHGSTAGTFIGNVRLEPHRAAIWKPSRKLRIAKTVFVLEMPNESGSSIPSEIPNTPEGESDSRRERSAQPAHRFRAPSSANIQVRQEPATCDSQIRHGKRGDHTRHEKSPRLIVIVLAAIIVLLGITIGFLTWILVSS